MTNERLQEIKKAKQTLCAYCLDDTCEWCKVEALAEAAEYEMNNVEDEDAYEYDYIRSSTNGDYGPSNPWNAPGMSVKDFI